MNPPLAQAVRERHLRDLLAPPGRSLPPLAAATERLNAAQRLISPECLTTCRTFLLFASNEPQEALELCRARGSVRDAGLCLVALIEQFSGGDPAELSELLVLHLPWMVGVGASLACQALCSVRRGVPWEGQTIETVTHVFAGYPLELCAITKYFVYTATLGASVSLRRLHTTYTSALVLVVKCLKQMSGTGSTAVDVAPGRETGLLGEWRTELMAHLRASDHYDTDAALADLSVAVDPHTFIGLATRAADLPLRLRVLRFYAKYNAGKMDSVDDALIALKGQSAAEVVAKLVAKYGPEPELDEEVLTDLALAATRGDDSHSHHGAAAAAGGSGGGGGTSEHGVPAPPAAALYSEAAVVHAKRNDDSSALHTLLYELRDVDAALAFCLETTANAGASDETSGASRGAQHQQQHRADAAVSRRDASLSLDASVRGASSPSREPGAFTLDRMSPTSLNLAASITRGAVAGGGGGGGGAGADDDNGGSPHNAALELPGRVTAAKTRSGRMLTLLVQKLLRPPPGFERKLDDAVSILSSHSESLDANAVLSVVPPDVPLACFAPYLSRHFEQASYSSTQLSVRAQTLASENYRLQQQLHRLNNRAVLVDDERLCAVCDKKLGDVMVVVYPNLRVVHFRCAKDRSRDPVTNLPFLQTIV